MRHIYIVYNLLILGVFTNKRTALRCCNYYNSHYFSECNGKCKVLVCVPSKFWCEL